MDSIISAKLRVFNFYGKSEMEWLWMWKCNPSDINSCLNCQYPECVCLKDADNDAESLKFDAEVRYENGRVNAKNIAMYRYKHSEKGLKKRDEYNHSDNAKARKIVYNHSEKGKEAMQRHEMTEKRKAYKSNYQKIVWCKREEQNKGYCYGILVNQKGVTVGEIAKQLNTDHKHVLKYITELIDEQMIEFKF